MPPARIELESSHFLSPTLLPIHKFDERFPPSTREPSLGEGDSFIVTAVNQDQNHVIKTRSSQLTRDQFYLNAATEAFALAMLGRQTYIACTGMSVEKIAVPRIAGPNLQELGRRLDQKDLLQYTAKAAREIAAAHQDGVTIADIKLENFILADDGRRIVNIDFSAAKINPFSLKPKSAATLMQIISTICGQRDFLLENINSWNQYQKLPRNQKIIIDVLLQEKPNLESLLIKLKNTDPTVLREIKFFLNLNLDTRLILSSGLKSLFPQTPEKVLKPLLQASILRTLEEYQDKSRNSMISRSELDQSWNDVFNSCTPLNPRWVISEIDLRPIIHGLRYLITAIDGFKKSSQQILNPTRNIRNSSLGLVKRRYIRACLDDWKGLHDELVTSRNLLASDRQKQAILEAIDDFNTRVESTYSGNIIPSQQEVDLALIQLFPS